MFKRQENSKKAPGTLLERVNKQSNLDAGMFNQLPPEVLFFIYTFAALDFFKFPLVCKQFYKLFNLEEYKNHANAVWKKKLGESADTIRDPKKFLIEKYRRHNELKKVTSGVIAFFEKRQDQNLKLLEKYILEDDPEALAEHYELKGETTALNLKFQNKTVLNKLLEESLPLIIKNLAYKCFDKCIRLLIQAESYFGIRGYIKILVEIMKTKLSRDMGNYFTRKVIQLLLDKDCHPTMKVQVFSEFSELKIENLEKNLTSDDKEKLFAALTYAIRTETLSSYPRPKMVAGIKTMLTMMPSLIKHKVTEKTLSLDAHQIFKESDLEKTLLDFALHSSPAIQEFFKELGSNTVLKSFEFEEKRKDAINISRNLMKLYENQEIDFTEINKLIEKLSTLSTSLKEIKDNSEKDDQRINYSNSSLKF